jgi:acetolactate synthase-1/2/3 large subunit
MSYTVGDLVAEFLHAAGVTTAFGIVSVHNIPMLDAIGRRNTIRFVPARGEMGGSHMADAYARVSGGRGVLLTSTGPGAANGVPGGPCCGSATARGRPARARGR